MLAMMPSTGYEYQCVMTPHYRLFVLVCVFVSVNISW